jgi:hypothetical protein
VAARLGGRSSSRGGASMADDDVWACVWDCGRLLKARTSVHGRVRLLHDTKEGTRGGDAATSRCAAREGLGRGGSSAQRVAWHTLSQARQHGEGCTMMALPSSQSCMSWGPGRRGAPTAAWHRAQTCARGVRSRARGRRCLARSTPV